MRSSYLLLPIFCLLGCDALFAPWKQINDLACSGDGGCTIPPPVCADNDTSCTPTDGSVSACQPVSCTISGCWEQLCVSNLQGQDLTAVWVGDTDTVWVTSNRGNIFAVNRGSAATATAVSQAFTTTPIPTQLSGIFGSSELDLWAVGNDGIAIHRGTDSTWAGPHPQAIVTMYDVAGTGPANFWAVGANNDLLKFSGTAWGVTEGTQNELRGVWTDTNGNTFAVGLNGFILKYTTATNGVVQTPQTSLPLNHIWGTIAGDLWIAGGDHTQSIVMHGKGAPFDKVYTDTGFGFTGVWGNATDVWLVGYGGRILRVMDMTTPVAELSPTNQPLAAISGGAMAGIWAVGANGTLLHRMP